MGAGEHTDFGMLTVVAQNNVPGLEVKAKDGTWQLAPSESSIFMVNIGDLVARLTNNQYSAPIHRAVNRSGRDRYFLVFFMDTDFNSIISPLTSCISKSDSSRCAPISTGKYILSRVNSTTNI
ncbi:MAG: 2OG-Fe(II) oxygenase family protein [Polaromonas sp.]